jgi:hypothetical protein
MRRQPKFICSGSFSEEAVVATIPRAGIGSHFERQERRVSFAILDRMLRFPAKLSGVHALRMPSFEAHAS